MHCAEHAVRQGHDGPVRLRQDSAQLICPEDSQIQQPSFFQARHPQRRSIAPTKGSAQMYYHLSQAHSKAPSSNRMALLERSYNTQTAANIFIPGMLPLGYNTVHSDLQGLKPCSSMPGHRPSVEATASSCTEPCHYACMGECACMLECASRHGICQPGRGCTDLEVYFAGPMLLLLPFARLAVAPHRLAQQVPSPRRLVSALQQHSQLSCALPGRSPHLDGLSLRHRSAVSCPAGVDRAELAAGSRTMWHSGLLRQALHLRARERLLSLQHHVPCHSRC